VLVLALGNWFFSGVSCFASVAAGLFWAPAGKESQVRELPFGSLDPTSQDRGGDEARVEPKLA
jgi:hypothetical protein